MSTVIDSPPLSSDMMHKNFLVMLILLGLVPSGVTAGTDSSPGTVSSAAGSGAAAPSHSPREIVQAAMRQRPDDPWPRGLAHVVLAIPGSQQPEKGYHEPGGSFSPAVGSFGVSIWVRDADGKLKTTSDALPIEHVRQRLHWPDPQGRSRDRHHDAALRGRLVVCRPGDRNAPISITAATRDSGWNWSSAASGRPADRSRRLAWAEGQADDQRAGGP